MSRLPGGAFSRCTALRHEVARASRAVGQNAERDVDGLVANEALIPDLDPDGVEEDQRIERVEWPVLPFAHFLQHRIGHGRDQVGRHVDAVELLQVAADLAHRHATRIHGDDLLVEIGKAALAFGDQLGVEGPGPVTRDRQGHLQRGGQDRLLRMPVATVGRAIGLALIVQVLIQFGVKNALRQRLLQVVDKTVPGENLVRIAARKQLIQ